MKDYPIGQVFTHPTLGKLKAIEKADGDCKDCIFCPEDEVCTNDADNLHTGECAAQYRIDHTDVIFVKADKTDCIMQCGDNRFEVVTKAKEDLLKRTDIASHHAEMAVLNNFLMYCYQMGWLSQYDPICKVPKDDNEPLYHY